MLAVLASLLRTVVSHSKSPAGAEGIRNGSASRPPECNLVVSLVSALSCCCVQCVTSPVVGELKKKNNKQPFLVGEQNVGAKG